MDPVTQCKLYKDQGCSHVDGYLCDFPFCSMNEDYKKGIEAGAERMKQEVDREVLERLTKR